MRASLLRPLAFRLSPDVLPGGCQLGSLNMGRLQARKRRPVSVRTRLPAANEAWTVRRILPDGTEWKIEVARCFE